MYNKLSTFKTVIYEIAKIAPCKTNYLNNLRPNILLFLS